MHVLSTLIPALGLFAHLGTARYTLADDYGQSFFDKFSFFTDDDPTNGFVNYVDRQTASSGGLINEKDGSIYIGVDHQNTADTSGRQSVRLTSTKTYNHGLVILDLAHMPGNICGTWPAFWMLGPDWPNNGEIDIIEGVNQQSSNQITLHTSPGCSIKKSGFSGGLTTYNCDVKASGQTLNAGCSIDTHNSQSYGGDFNQAKGGIYATEWTSESINVWFFPRSKTMSDIDEGNPNPSSWGVPTAKFTGDCDIDSHFKNHRIVFDITFCGDWAGKTWSDGCSSKGNTCNDFVSNNPSEFAESYWDIKSLKVYQDGGGAQASASVGVNLPGASAQASLSVGGGFQPSTPSNTAPPGGQSSNGGQYDDGQYHPPQASSAAPQAGQWDQNNGQDYQAPASSSAPQAGQWDQNNGQDYQAPASSSAPQAGQWDQNNGQDYQAPVSSAAPQAGQWDQNNGQDYQAPVSSAAPQAGQWDQNNGQDYQAPASSSAPQAGQWDQPQPSSTAPPAGQWNQPQPQASSTAPPAGQWNQSQNNGQYNNGQYNNGQYNNGQYNNGQYNNGQYNNGQYNNGQYNNGQYNNGQYNNGQYDDGKYHGDGGSQPNQNTQWKKLRR